MKKIIASILAAFFVVLSPISAFASTTESMMMYSMNTRAIPNNYHILCSAISLNKDTNLWGMAEHEELLDGVNYSNDIFLSLAGNTGDLLVGFNILYHPSIDGGFYSNHLLDFSTMQLNFIDSNASYGAFTLSPTAVPIYAYAEYSGTYDFQYYDGSVGYKRYIYDNEFKIRKPIEINLTNFGQIFSDSATGFDMYLSTPAISGSDILDVTAYRNQISQYLDFTETTIDSTEFITIEDYPTDNIRINNDLVSIFVLYQLDDMTFIPYSYNADVSLPLTTDNCYFYCTISPSKYNGNLTSINVNSLDYLDKITSGYQYITNGFYMLKNSIGSSLSNVVTNATQNADRIIQNTIQKVDEVKQGVTDVKDSVIETKNSILDLPNKIKDMLLGLIVPSSETMANKYTEFSQLLEQKLGIIYQIPMMLFSFFDTIVNAATTPQSTLTLPAFTLPWIDGTTLTIWEPIEYKIIPDGMQVLSDLIQTVTSMTVVVLTFNSVKQAYERFLRS